MRAATAGEAPAIARIHWDSWVATYTGVFAPQMFDEFAALRLWVVAGNPAEAFYRAMGAQPIGSTSFDSHGVPLRENCYRATLG